MAANASDLVRNATPNFATTLANSMLISDTSLTLSSGTGLPTATGITLVIDATNSAGTYTPTVMEVVTGTLSGTTLSNLKRGLDGSTQQGHASGANVVMWITANLWNDWQTAFLLGHSQLTGAHLPSLPLTTPEITTSLLDANGNTWIGQTATASAVNYINVTDAATTTAPVISAKGSDTSIGITLTPKGSGVVTLPNSTVTPNMLGTGAASATVTTSQTTTSTSYADLATAGPSVTVTIGSNGLALIVLTTGLSNSGTNYSRMGFVVSGANTIAATNNQSLAYSNASAGVELDTSYILLLTGLSAGSTTFKAQYNVSAGTGTFDNRSIAVVPL